MRVQTAAFEPDVAEALPYKPAVAVAAEMAGLLEGSSRVRPRRGGAGHLRDLDAVPQARGCATTSMLTSSCLWQSCLRAVRGGGVRLHDVVYSRKGAVY